MLLGAREHRLAFRPGHNIDVMRSQNCGLENCLGTSCDILTCLGDTGCIIGAQHHTDTTAAPIQNAGVCMNSGKSNPEISYPFHRP